MALSVSSDGINWVHLFSDHLSDVRNIACADIPLDIMEIDRSGRFVKLDLLSWFQAGATLQHVDIEYVHGCSGKYLVIFDLKRKQFLKK